MRRGQIQKGFEKRFDVTRCMPSTDRPPVHRPEARAAFDRMMRYVRRPMPGGSKKHPIMMRVCLPRLDKLTKIVALLAELRALRQEDSNARAIIFTQYDKVQELVVEALQGSGFQVFEFNKDTPPTKRHKIIKEFQEGLVKDGIPKVCIATYHVAAVGVTLTAANRVFLMEPSPDPATEAQAAGRIHRLGQTKEILIKRFAFRNTIEHAIVDMHEEIKAKRVAAGATNDSKVVRDVLRRLKLDEVPHTPDPAMTREVIWKQTRPNVGGLGRPPTWWKIQRTKCLCCKRVYDISAEKLAGRPPEPFVEDRPWYQLTSEQQLAWPDPYPKPVDPFVAAMQKVNDDKKDPSKYSEDITAFNCYECKIFHEREFSGSVIGCREKGHTIKKVPCKKRWFECGGCKHRTTEINLRWPTSECGMCNQLRWNEVEKPKFHSIFSGAGSSSQGSSSSQ